MLGLFDVREKKIMVTGGSGGLGRSVAEGLLEAGAEVVVFGSSEKAAQTEREFVQRGLNAHSVSGDLSNEASLNRCFEQALAALDGAVDVLVNAAGILRRGRSEDFSIADWNAVMNLNLTATFLLSQLAARNMIQRGKGGKIINFASLVSFFGGQTVPAYAASKGGVAQLTKALCNDWAKYKINVNAIAPGYFDTPMNAASFGDEKRSSEIVGRIPLGRWGAPEDLKGIAIFLSSSASDYISGAVIPVDGGYLCK
ncbi:MAG: SDR family oxidoreductase [Clostridiaceae bacterium]